MSAKTYRDSFAVPLVNLLKDIVKNLTIQCIRLKGEVLHLRERVKQLAEDIEFYKGKIKNNNMQAQNWQERAEELELVKEYFGTDQIDRIIDMANRQEHIEGRSEQWRAI